MHAFVKALIALRHRYNDWIIQGQIDMRMGSGGHDPGDRGLFQP